MMPRQHQHRRSFGGRLSAVTAALLAGWPRPVMAQDASGPVEVLTEFRMLPEGWWAVAAVGATLFGLWLVIRMYRREGRSGAGPKTRLFLAMLRCLVILLLIGVFLEPVRVEIMRRWVESYTIVLADTSSSMDLSESYRDDEERARVGRLVGEIGDQPVKRVDVASQVLSGGSNALLDQLAKKNTVRFYRFDREPHLLETIAAKRRGQGQKTPPVPEAKSDEAEASGDAGAPMAAIPLEANGPATNLDRALRRVVEAAGGAPIAGVVVISDGGFNEGGSADDIARFAAERDIALHTVAIGDPSPPRNVRVVEVEAPTNVLQKDPFNLTARLALEGVAGETLQIRLLEREESSGAPAQIVEQRSLLVEPGTATAELRFERRKTGVGRFTYEVSVEPIPGESLADDNAAQATVNVIDTRTRVLLIAGGPSWEYRYLSRLLIRDESFNVSCWLQSADVSAVRDGNTIIDHLPRFPEELFVYDVIVMLDPDPKEFDNEWCRNVDRLVTDYGGGLMFEAARTYSPSFLRESELRPLTDLLPVVLDPEADLVLNQIGYYQERPSPFIIPEGAAAHPAMQLADDPVASRLVWQQIGEVYWHYPVLREKPVATVLLRDGDPRMRNTFGPHVLAAVQFAGAGRSGFLAFDGTWRWRQYGAELHERFWVQMLRFLAEGRLLGGSRRINIQTDSDSVVLGDSVTVKARLLNERYEPLGRDRVTGEFEIGGERQTFSLESQTDRPGWYEGRFIPRQTGVCRVRIRLAEAAGGDSVEASRDLRVARPNLEMRRPQADPAAMRLLAEQSAGGRYYAVDEARAMTDAIEDLHEEVPVRSRPQPLWDNGVLMGVIVGLLALEWAVRKWNQLL